MKKHKKTSIPDSVRDALSIKSSQLAQYGRDNRGGVGVGISADERKKALAAFYIFIQGYQVLTQASVAFPKSHVVNVLEEQASSIGYLTSILGVPSDPLRPQYPWLPPQLMLEARHAFADLTASVPPAHCAENESRPQVSSPQTAQTLEDLQRRLARVEGFLQGAGLLTA